MSKVRTSIVLPEELLKQARAQNINISQVAAEAVAASLKGYHLRDEDMHLRYLLKRRESLNKLLKQVNSRVSSLQRLKSDLDKEIEEQRRFVEEVKRSQRVAAIIRELNEIVLSFQGDFDECWKQTKSLRAELEKLEHPVDEEWMKVHIERVLEYFR